MEILKESSEKLPINVVTDLVSEGWNEVGKLKSEIEAVKGFAGSKEVSEVLQKLADAYLVCIGQLEAFLSDKKYIKEADELKEDVNIHIEDNEVRIADAFGEEVAIIPVDPDKEEAGENSEEEEITAPVEEVAPIEEPVIPHDTFEYFVDFDDVDPSAEPITDAELEQLQKVNR